MQNLFDLIGRLHPLVVHLPIGFILLGLLLIHYVHKNTGAEKVLPYVFFWASIASVASFLTGIIQYLQEGLSLDDVRLHLVFGLLTTLLCMLFYIKLKGATWLEKIAPRWWGWALFVSLVATGHFGGNLTHGEDHLTEPLPTALKNALGISSPPDAPLLIDPEKLEASMWFDDVIQPLLQQKCVSCHNAEKQKGKLALHRLESFQKGGKNGALIDVENPEKSLLWTRIHLPITDKKHMPPKSKTQLSAEEIALLQAWMGIGAPVAKTLAEAAVSPEILQAFYPPTQNHLMRFAELPSPSATVIQNLQNQGLLIAPLFKNSNGLKISAINWNAFTDKDINALAPLAKNIVLLDLGNTQITDAVFETLQTFENLVDLKLDHTLVKGNSMEVLEQHAYLESINLVSSAFAVENLSKLYSFQTLEKVFLWDTPAAKEIEKSNLPQDKIQLFDFGEELLPKLPSDGIVY